LQNWLYVSFCFFAWRFLFFIYKVFNFCKVLCVVECCDLCKICHLAIVTTLSSYWFTSFFFFFFKGIFFWFVDLFIATSLCCWEIHLVHALLRHSQIQHVYVFLKEEQITLWKKAL
jgi:hypothetical protein